MNGQQQDPRLFMNMHDLRANNIWRWSSVVEDFDPRPLVGRITDYPLNNPIHPIFARENWRTYEYEPWDGTPHHSMESCNYYDPAYNVSPFLYETISPALRLATLMMQKVRPILVRIVRCPEREHEGSHRFDPLWVPAADDYGFLDWCLGHLARDIAIMRIRPQPATPMVTLGSTSALFDRCFDHDKTRNPIPVIMGISGDLLDECADEHEWNLGDVTSRHCILFKLALILVHEIGHALYWRRHYWGVQKLFFRGRQHPPTYTADLAGVVEPSMPFEADHELGLAVTRYLMHAQIWFPYGQFRTMHDRQTGNVPNQRRPVFDGSRGLMVVNPNGGSSIDLSEGTVLTMFDRTTWEGDLLYFDMRLLPGQADPNLMTNVPAANQGNPAVQHPPIQH